jgi:anaerobic selenocysteine-containing dehydrogenase
MMPGQHYQNCNICEAICGIAITVEGDKLDIRGDADDPFSRGYICPKAVGLQDIHYDQDRLRQPVRRTASGWQSIEWDEAFDEVAHNLKSIQAKYGRSAVATYLGNPTVHSSGALLFAPGFIRSLHTRNRFSATSVDQLAHHVAGYLMFGHQLLLPIPDLERTKFLLMLGANPAVSNGSMVTAPGMSRHLKEIRARGGRVVLIDPRRTETARLADRHLFIRPATDVLLMLALLHVVFDEQLVRLGNVSSFTDNVEDIRRVVRDFSPEKVAPITGIAAEEIRSLAREFATAESAVCYGRMGVSTQEFGGACQWLINVLNTVTGNLDRPGGAMFTLPAFDPINAPESIAPRGSFGRWHTRVRHLPEFAGELPVAALAEEMLAEGTGQIKALVTHAGNPVLSTPNGRQLDDALAGLEFMAAIDFYINETTRHANIILPPTSALERSHYDLAFYLLGIRNIAKFSPALFTPNKDSRHDWQIFLELQTRMEGNSFVGSLKRKLGLHFLHHERLLDLGLRFGPYGGKLNPFAKGLTLRQLKASPHGIDLGPLKSCLPERLPNKRIQLAPAVFVNDIERATARFFGPDASHSNGHLSLIGRRQLRSNNSWMHNSERFLRGRHRCTLIMNPEDAAARQLKPGQPVTVKSKAGSVEVPLEISDTIMPGVVSLPHGWGHNRHGVRLEVAQKHAGGSLNDVTDHLAVDELSGAAALNGTPVQVEGALNSSLTQERKTPESMA